MNRQTGQTIPRLAHIIQSVLDILTTPIGTRVMRRSYGSKISDLVDAPGHEVTVLRLIAASAHAINQWEPRARLRRGNLSVGADGRAVMSLDLVTTADASPLSVDVGLSLMGAA